MDEGKIVEAMALAAYGSFYGKVTLEQWSWLLPVHREPWLKAARAAWDAAKAALAEAAREPLRELEAAARIACRETLAAPNAPGWPAVCAVLRHVAALREVLAAAHDDE